MGLFKLYNWVLPKQAQFIEQFSNNEPLYKGAKALWESIDSAAIYYFAFCIIIGILIAIVYYYPINKLPRRKYKITHWVLWLFITAALCILFTRFFGGLIVDSNLNEKVNFLTRISVLNGFYALSVYFITSLVICNTPCKTNAYKFLKFTK